MLVDITNQNPKKRQNCSYKLLTKELLCKEFDPLKDIDDFVKDTIYNARHPEFPKFLELVPFKICVQ